MTCSIVGLASDIATGLVFWSDNSFLHRGIYKADLETMTVSHIITGKISIGLFENGNLSMIVDQGLLWCTILGNIVVCNVCWITIEYVFLI